ncbi:MAG TPA: sigma-70 family RNA polymerase sigma factor [Pyrinomonadaceae bacterium]
MKSKLSEAAEQADEPNHTANRNTAELKAKRKNSSATTKKETQLIENQKMDALVEQLRKDWANSDFLKLVNDSEFMDELERTCREVTSGFPPLPSFSWEDLMQDVIERIVKALPNFRHESKLMTWIYGIAYNRTVDVHRRPGNKAPSMNGTKIQGRNGEEYELDGEETEGGEPANRFVENHRNHTEERRFESILCKELKDTLSDEDRSLCHRYFDKGLSMPEIAKEDGRSRQAVSNHFGRVMKKLRKHLS